MNLWTAFRGLLLIAGFAASISAVAAEVIYFGSLSGPAESPANPSAGTGTTLVTIDSVAHHLVVDVTFSGLGSPDTAAHIHCCTMTPFALTAGVATQTPSFAGFPAGVTAGTYHNEFDTTLTGTFNPSFVSANGGSLAAAEAALFYGIAHGLAYLNIHTGTYPGGEIRSFLYPDAVFANGFD